ncbi:MAG TPA: GGDEF domain-containing protein [Methylomirabilota bacterium]|nr:GGDEF domain-containing protein [Methylomirabilota bacterium]
MSRPKSTLALALSGAIILVAAALVLVIELRVRPLYDPARLGFAMPVVEGLLVVVAVLAGGLMVVTLRRAGAAPAVSAPLPIDLPDQALSGGNEEVGAMMGAFSRILGRIEEQGNEIQNFAHRLEAAHKDLELSNARLKEYSFKDEVTGLYNRRFYSIRLEEEVSRYRRFNHPVSVVLVDLDGFKEINDDLGHGAGDDTLRDMSDILLRYSRGINVICRYGGDEFAVLLVETSKAGAKLYADRIRQVLSTHRFAHGRRLTASFGIASLPEDVAPGADDLMRAADEALYAAKRAGKNRVSVFEDVAPAPRQTGRPT